MAQKKQLSLKRVGLDKTNSHIFIATGAAAFLVTFFLVASYSLFGQMMYQNRVISVKKTAVNQLEDNIEASKTLMESYQTFISGPQNFLGGNPAGNGPLDGPNAKLALDALPSKYDFPALTASLEKVLIDQRVKIQSISGTDESLLQESDEPIGNPVPTEMPFEVNVGGDFQTVQGVVSALERSIRPMQIQTIEVTGDQVDLAMKITAKTFYQAEKTLNIEMKVVK